MAATVKSAVGKPGYMLETLSIQKYAGRENLLVQTISREVFVTPQRLHAGQAFA